MNPTVDRDWAAGLRQGLLIGAALLVLGIPPARMPSASTASAPAPRVDALRIDAAPRRADFAGEPASSDARRLAQAVVDSADNGGLAFVVVDKTDARVFVFDDGGSLQGATPVLLGHARGDDSVPGIGLKAIADVRPEERTTPAGRFVAEPGRNTLGEDVVWVDYDAAVSMHRVRVTHADERRLERLQSPTAADNRISYGCINLPVAFFETVLWPRARGGQRLVVYVLPETRPLADAFPALPLRLSQATAGAVRTAQAGPIDIPRSRAD